MTDETSKLVLSTSERIMYREISEDDALLQYDQWSLSNPIPGARIINSWEIYHNIWIVLAVTEEGLYCIFRSIDQKKFALVHEHDSRIYGIFYLEAGHAIFCAEDGWWKTVNTGQDWVEFASLCEDMPKARSVAIVATAPGEWLLTAYAEDHKLYTCEYPDGEWVEAYDTTEIWTDKWYPALAGSPVGVLVGAGDKLLRSDSWNVIQTVDGIIKSIVVSDQSNTPVFLIEVEQADSALSKLYWTYDLGDSLVPDLNRSGAIAAVQAVYLTGTNIKQTMFAVTGKRTPDGMAAYKLITNEGS